MGDSLLHSNIKAGEGLLVHVGVNWEILIAQAAGRVLLGWAAAHVLREDDIVCVLRVRPSPKSTAGKISTSTPATKSFCECKQST